MRDPFGWQAWLVMAIAALVFFALFQMFRESTVRRSAGCPERTVCQPLCFAPLFGVNNRGTVDGRA